MSNDNFAFLWSSQFLFLFCKKILFILERGKEGERKGEKQECVVASHTPPAGHLARNPGMCPRLGIEPVLFDSQAGTQYNEPNQLGLYYFFLLYKVEYKWKLKTSSLAHHWK